MQNKGNYHLGWRKEKTIFGPLCEKWFFCHSKFMWNRFIELLFYHYLKNCIKIKIESPTLISRKIWVTGNVSKFHTVKSTYFRARMFDEIPERR